MFEGLKNILSLLPQMAQFGAVNEEKKKRRSSQSKLVDLMEARMLSEDARTRNIELNSILKKNSSNLNQVRTRQRVRKQVKEQLAPRFRQHPEIVEEVTETLVSAAANDPFYKRWFS
jgi:hypothetical protein